MLSGKKLGRYEIRHKIGAGGMGEVYLAQDEQLDRKVALKVLPAEFCSNLERVQRFKQEAKAASALNHPNIITIYEIGEVDDEMFISTEFVEGETLRQKIESGKLSLAESIEIAEQIADALSVSHEAYIIHRDIKPENIMIRRDGYVKILDFGLAKPTNYEAGDDDITLQMVQTQEGVVMGSVRYMSPEQSRGKAVDGRTDIWSLGVVLYEMLTGKNPFDGETLNDALANVIHVEPPKLQNVPSELQRIISKTLRKKAAERYQNIKDLAADLKNLSYQLEHNKFGDKKTGKIAADTGDKKVAMRENPTHLQQTHSNKASAKQTQEFLANTEKRTVNKRHWSFIPLAIGGLLAVVVLGIWFFRSFGFRGSEKFNSLEIVRVIEGGKASAPTISNDGKYLAYINSERGKPGLVVQQTATGSTVQIVAPLESGEFLPPAFSPEGNYVFYTHYDKGFGTLYQIPTLGGTAKKIVFDVDTKVTFSPDGKQIAFVRHVFESGVDTIMIENSDGTNEQPFIAANEIGIKNIDEVAWSPVGDNLLVGGNEALVQGELVKSKLFIVSLKDKSVKPFADRNWLNAGSFNWVKDNSAVLMVAKSGEQDAAQIWRVSYPDGNEITRLTNDTSGYGRMSLAHDADMIAGAKQDTISSLWTLNPQTKELTQLTSENKNSLGKFGFGLMPDGGLLVSKSERNRTNLWRLDADGKDEKQLTDEESFNSQGAVSPDGRYIVFASSRSNLNGIWRMDADGKNPVQLTGAENVFDFKPLILADGKTVVFERRKTDLIKSILMKVSIDGGEASALFGDNPIMETSPCLSDDGKHFAYSVGTVDRTNNKFSQTVKIMAANDGAIGNLEKQFDINLGWNYKFTPDGKNLTYINSQGVPNLFNAPIDGTAQKPLTNFNSGTILNFRWSKDGMKLYIVRGIVNSEIVLLKDGGKE